MKRSQLTRRAPLARASQLAQRTAPLKHTAPPAARSRRTVPGKADAALAFRTEVLAHPCLMCGTDRDLQAHHCVEAQVLRRICRTEGLPDDAALALIYAPANGVSLCAACHDRHTSRFSPVPGDLLPGRVWLFAREVGPEALAALHRAHPGMDGTVR